MTYGKINYTTVRGVLKGQQNTDYIGDKNDISKSNYNAHQNTYFNIDIQQSAYFTMLVKGWEYGRFHTSFKSISTQTYDGNRNGAFDRFTENNSLYWMPLKSLQYSHGSIETMSLGVGAFADLQLPFRKHLPTLTVEMYDHRSDYFEMKLREWHAQSVLTEGFVPVLESIVKEVEIRGWATNGECNSVTTCSCILADDLTVSRSYEEDGFKLISFKLLVVGY